MIKVPSSKNHNDTESGASSTPIPVQENTTIEKENLSVKAGLSCDTGEVPSPVLKRESETLETVVTIDVIPSGSKNLVSPDDELEGVEAFAIKDKCTSAVQLPEKEEIKSVGFERSLDGGNEEGTVEPPLNDTDESGLLKRAEAGTSGNNAAKEILKEDEQPEEEIPKVPQQAVDKDSKTSKITTTDESLQESEHLPTSKDASSKGILKESEQPPIPEVVSSEKKALKTASTKTHALPKESAETEVPGTTTTINEEGPTGSDKKHLKSTSEKGDNLLENQSSKPGRTSSLKHKKQASKVQAVEKTPSSVKISKSVTVVKQERALKSDSNKKAVDVKEVTSRTSHDSHKKAALGKETAAPSHRTRSNSVTSRESSSKERRSSRKEEGTPKKPTAVTCGSDDSPSSSKGSSDAKSSLRSSRSRKSQADANSQDQPPVKKEKVKAVTETPVRPRQSERVSKATEKAIASGLVSRRSRSSTTDSSSNTSAKPQDSEREDQTGSHRRGKRKAESPSNKDDSSVNKRRTTRSSETPSSNDSSQSTTQSLRSVRKTKPLKRKASSNDL